MAVSSALQARVPQLAESVIGSALRHKVKLPDPLPDYVSRPEVEGQCTLKGERLTVLHAPAGFGKTVLLTRSCRTLRHEGVVVAWLSLDEKDGPVSIVTGLALAFEDAGLEIHSPATRQGGAHSSLPAPHVSSLSEYRLNVLTQEIARHGTLCVLALDQLDRLHDPAAVATINTLLNCAPPNLNIGMAFRRRPQELAIATFALEGRSVTVTEEELRFSASDISQFFGQRLSRRELAAVVADSAGWPIALHSCCYAARRKGPTAVGEDMVGGWIETQLWRGLSPEDRDFVLDIALLDRLEPDLISEVTGAKNAGRRIGSMDALAGLVFGAHGSNLTMRLHPLIKSHCERRRFAENPERFRALHGRIAEALVRHGRAVEALRHAVEAGDTALLGRIAERTGGVRLWLERGVEALRCGRCRSHYGGAIEVSADGVVALRGARNIGRHQRGETGIRRRRKRDDELHTRSSGR